MLLKYSRNVDSISQKPAKLFAALLDILLL